MKERKKEKLQSGKPTTSSKQMSKAARAPAIERHALWTALGMLAALLLVFFMPIFGGKKTFESPDHVEYMAHAPFLREAFGSSGSIIDKFPLWDPYVLSGMPAYASMLVAPYTNPMSAIFGFIPEIIRMVFFYFLLGTFCWVFLRRRGLGVFASVTGATTYVFSTHVITMIMFGHHLKLTTLVFLPLVLVVTDALWSRPTLRWTAVSALAISTMLLSGHFQIAFYSLCGAGLLLALNTVGAVRDRHGAVWIMRRWGLWVSGVLLGAVASAALTLPVLEYSASSIRGGGGGELAYQYATEWSLHPFEMATFFVPSFVGFGQDTYWGWMIHTDFPYYMGIFPLFLAVLALVLWPRERSHLCFLSFFVFALFLAFGRYLPILYRPFFEFVPFFDSFRVPSMSMVLVEFAVAMLAASSVDRLARAQSDRDTQRLLRRFQRTALAFAGIVLVLGGLAATGVLERSVAQRFVDRHLEFQRLEELDSNPVPTQELVESSKRQARSALALAKRDAALTLVILLVGVGLVGSRLKGRFARLQFLVGALALVVIDLWHVGVRPADYKQRTTPPESFRMTGAVQFLQGQSEPYRVFAMIPEGVSNWFEYFRIPSILGAHPAKLKVYQDLIDDEGPVGIRRAMRNSNFNLLNMLNTRFIVAHEEMKEGPFTTVLRSAHFVMRNEDALPRMWFVDRARVISDPVAHLREVGNPAWNPRDEALLFEDAGDFEPALGGSVTVTRYEPREIRATVRAPGNCLLVASEIFYEPGWHAWLDGTSTPIYRANYALRAVRVPPGTHDLKMRFDPPAFRRGLQTSAAAYGLIGLSLLASAVGGRRRRPPSSKAGGKARPG